MANKRKRRNKTRFVIFLLTISVLIFGIIKLGSGLKSIMGKQDMSLKKISSIEYTNSKQDGEKIDIEIFNEYIIKFEKNRLNAYDQDGEKVWEKSLSSKNVIIKGNKNIIVVADSSSGKIYYIDYKGEITLEKSLDREIVDIKINDSGYVLVMFEKKIDVLDSNGEIVSNIVIPKGEIFDGDISKDNSKIALTILAVEEKKFYSNIIFYSFDGKILAGKKYDNAVIYKIVLTDDNNLLILGDNSVLMLTEEDQVLWEKNFQDTLNKGVLADKDLLILSLVSKKNTIIDTKNRNTIFQMDLNGNILNKTPIAGEVLGLDVIDDRIAVCTGRTIYILGRKGNTILEKKINKDIKDINWISKKNLLVTYKNKMEVMAINY